MSHTFYTDLSLIVALAASISIIMRLLKQPLIIGYIATGLIAGPSLLNTISDIESFQIFADIGIALLLFLVGLGLNPKVVKEVGKIALLTGIGQVAFTTSIGYLVISSITDLAPVGSFYLALAISFSSTIIVLKLLSDKKEQTRLHGKIAIGFLLVQDLIATMALLFVSTNGSDGISGNDFAVIALKGVGLAFALYVVSKFIIPQINKIVSKNQELLFLFSIAWGLGIGALFKEFGFSLEIGALAAGVSLSSFSYAQEITSRLKPLRDFFLVLFFIILGSRLDMSNISEVIMPASIISALILIGKPIIVMSIMGILGYKKKTSFKTSLAVSQISEFSLVLLLLAEKMGKIDEKTLSLATLVGIVTIGISSYMIIYDEKLYNVISKYLSMFERKKTSKEPRIKQNNELILFGYKKGGYEFIKLFKNLKRPYVVIDYNPENIDSLINHKTNYLYGDMTDIELLHEAGISDAKLVVSVVTDHATNKFLLSTLENINQNCTVICNADSIEDAIELYQAGASYVMLPHYIGSEKISSFIKKSGLSKREFKKFRDKHMEYLLSNHESTSISITE